MNLGQNPGRPAYPRPAGLAPLQTLPRLRSRGIVMNSSVSVPKIGRRLIEWTERLAQGSKAPPFSAKTCPSQQSTSLEDHKRPLATSVQQRAERSQREADWPPLGRPAWTCLLSSNASYTDSRKQSGTSTQRRWPDGQNPRPAGLGEAGRPHSAATQALASREG